MSKLLSLENRFQMNLEKSIVNDHVRKITQGTPTLNDLTEYQLERIGNAIKYDSLKEALNRKVNTEKIDYVAEKELFLRTLGRKEESSLHTRKAYLKAITAFEQFAVQQKTPLLEMCPRNADDFTLGLNLSSASVRLVVAACSSFFSFLERRYSFISNPFRGLRSKPKKETKMPVLPLPNEIESLTRHSQKGFRTAFLILRDHGLRVGALPSLCIRDGKYKGFSKTKVVTGTISEYVIEAINTEGLDPGKPYGTWTVKNLTDALQYQIRRQLNAGTIQTKFSCHDLRHRFAAQKYRETHDIILVRNLLGHSSVSTTELYLRTLGVT